MNNYIFTSNGKKYKRIDKRIARKMYDAGHNIILCACNLRPFSQWHAETETNKKQCDNTTFDYLVNQFEFYNCINSETGKHASYYTALE